MKSVNRFQLLKFKPKPSPVPSTLPSGSMADKMQRLILMCPIAAHEVEKLIDRLLAQYEDNRSVGHD